MGQIGLGLAHAGLIGVVIFGFLGTEPLLHNCLWLAGGGLAIIVLGLMLESKNGDPGFRLMVGIGVLGTVVLLW